MCQQLAGGEENRENTETINETFSFGFSSWLQLTAAEIPVPLLISHVSQDKVLSLCFPLFPPL